MRGVSISDRSVEGGTALPGTRRARLAAWLSALSAALLVFGELVAVDAAFAWSIGNQAGASGPVVWTVAAIGLAGAAAISIGFFRTGLRNEYSLLEPGIAVSVADI